ncbi:hypothetical protein KC323_g116 [Hortaea werneckii]|nr:hypothetical protein KC323_g116 [Hortaea werneckii]KAI7360120.1 hypothetical protein KC320_g57 [Hortaea werneckii]
MPAALSAFAQGSSLEISGPCKTLFDGITHISGHISGTDPAQTVTAKFMGDFRSRKGGVDWQMDGSDVENAFKLIVVDLRANPLVLPSSMHRRAVCGLEDRTSRHRTPAVVHISQHRTTWMITNSNLT